MHQSKYLLILISFALTVFTTSCNTDEECTENVETKANIKFIELSIGDEVVQENDLSVNNLIVFATERENDSIYNFQNGLTEILLPFNPNTQMTAFAINADEIQDTIYFHHQSEMEFVSMSCGFTWFFTLEEVTHTSHAIDSVIVTDSIINLDEKNNYKIYFR